MSNEWAHDAARKEVPTEMKNLFHDGCVRMTDVRAAAAAGAYLRAVVTTDLLGQGKGTRMPARSIAYTQVIARPRTPITFQNNPFMTPGAVIGGASSGPHRAWDPV